MRACHCGPDPQSHTLPSSRNTLRPYWFDRMRCRVKPGRTRREYMLHFGTPTFYTEMQADTHIEAVHKEVHVITKTKAGYNTHSIQFSGVTIACSRTT